ncbi:hypothetical protein D8674_026076 [Pyrus ussuriensis x Pyrus communis]|uniref:Uncharacterized protein n=1 Tax=Pyrus ussuriensis x Pyrus communis TaxID=2448454 RepID=A0A5N5IAQ2_9ROSA|nr:hypothetical protein D8674_026076 [Pyrus ussuriensis x Pyrus communis]
MGKVQVRETSTSSSKSNIIEVDALKEEVTTLKGQLAIQEEQMRAQGEQMRAQLRVQGDKMKTYAKTVRDLVRAIQMSSLQISLPTPHLAPPSTSKPPRPTDTQ